MSEAEIQFRPEGRTEQLWILTPRHVTVVNKMMGTSATITVEAFTEEYRRRKNQTETE